MNSAPLATDTDAPASLGVQQALPWAFVAIASFHLAFSFAQGGLWIIAFLFSLLQLSRLEGRYQGTALGWGVGLLVFGPQLRFFWTVFGPGAIALWLVLAFWLRLFLVLLRLCRRRFGLGWAAVAAPFLWTGLEYFRSELYYLRFSWLIPGYAFAWSPALPVLHWTGMYGIGFVLMALAAVVWVLPRRAGLMTAGVLAVLLAFLSFVPNSSSPSPGQPSDGAATKVLRVAGMQLEFPPELEVTNGLARLRREQPQADLLVLSEYTFDGPVPENVRNWCRSNHVYLVAGAKDAVGDAYRNTVFVIAPSGELVFQQAKAVPIQFFKDGLPAARQQVWDSPWGRIGICICYDLSYTRVVDELVRQGAQALLVPTMDVAEWGEAQHRLHARVAPVRAAEHGLPIFRLASSGISQWVDDTGRVRASASFQGEGDILAAEMKLPARGRRPLDRFLAPLAVGVTGLLTGMLGLQEFLAARTRRRQTATKV